MTIALVADRAAAALLMLAAGILLTWPARARRTRAAWLALVVLGASYGLALNLQPVNFPNSNFAHYYLGAKYPVPYMETYRLLHAGEGRPQIGMRDLERPVDLVRSGTSEQRAYYIDLLRAARVPFDPLAPLDTLAARAHDSGEIEAEARRILATRLPARRVAAYRRDVHAALGMGQGAHLSLDYGYNGSPLYGLIRQADPTLHLPFGRLSALAGLAWQLFGVALIALLAGAALGLSQVEQLAVAALILASAEFAKYAMPGLVFTELWVPLLLATWALRRGRPGLAGASIAFAGLLKLFPFLLAATAAVPLVRSFGPGAQEPDAAGIRRRALTLLVSCAVSTLGLGLLALASGRTWTDFLHKIALEFQSGINMINSVSAAAALATLGVPDRSPLGPALALAALVPLLALFWKRCEAAGTEVLSRRALVLVAATGWLVKSWLNYYTIVPLVLLPLVARRHRRAAATVAVGMAAAYLLPDFDDPTLVQNPLLHLVKLVPYLAAPAWLVWLELREERWGRRARRVALGVVGVLGLATAVEAWRGGEIRRLAAAGETALERSDAGTALAAYQRLAWLSPRDPRIERKRAIALAMSDRLDEALAGFARAVALAPQDPAAHDDYGRALILAGRSAEAAAQLEAARALTPSDVQILFQLARVRLAEGRTAAAVALLARARELAPEEPAIASALDGIRAR